MVVVGSCSFGGCSSDGNCGVAVPCGSCWLSVGGNCAVGAACATLVGVLERCALLTGVRTSGRLNCSVVMPKVWCCTLL